MIKALAILVAAGFLALPSRAQSDTSGERYFARNAIFAELGGAGIGLSVNYERLVTNRMGFRVGYGAAAYNLLIERAASGGWLVGGVHLIPVSTWPAERGAAIEIGVTAGRIHTQTRRLFSDQVEESSQTTVAVQISYAFRPVSGGMFFRLGAGPLMGFSAERSIGIPYFSISAGRAF